MTVTAPISSKRQREEHPSCDGPLPGRVGPWELGALGAILLGFAVLSLTLLFERPPPAHDESVYALRARYYAGEGSGLGYWNDFRAPGLPLLARLVWPLGETDGYLRALVLGISLCGIFVTWAWARRFFGIRAGLYAAALLAVMPTYLTIGYLLYVDIPSAVFGMGAILLFLLAVANARATGKGLPWWVALSVPCAVIATACRFGAPLLVGPGMAIVAMAHWGTVKRIFWQVAALAAAIIAPIWAILFVPEVTGASRPPLTAFRELTGPQWKGFWAPYSDLINLTPDVIGPFAGALAILGLITAIYAAVRQRISRRDLVIVIASAVSFVFFLNLNLPFLVPQYLVPAFPFVALAAGAGLGWLTRGFSKAAVSVVLAAMLAYGWWVAYRPADGYAQAHVARRSALRETAQQLRGQYGPDCVVFTSYVMVGWYSGCTVLLFPVPQAQYTPDEYVAEMRRLLSRALDEGVSCDAEVLVVLVDRGKRQPSGERAALVHRLMGEPIIVSRVPEPKESYRHVVGSAGTVRDMGDDPRCEPGR